MTRPQLSPHSGTEATVNGWIATSHRPWMELVMSAMEIQGTWICMSYRASYLDHLVRPLIRFETDDGTDEWDAMSAPLFGMARWIGRVPDKTRRIFISPVDRAGPFGFEVDAITPISRAQLLARAFRRNFKTAAMALGARFIHARQEARQALMFARGGTPLKAYAAWRGALERPYEPHGLDAPRCRPEDRPHIRFVISPRDKNARGDAAIVSSLLAGAYDNWSLCVSNDAPHAFGTDPQLVSHVVVAPSGQSDVTDGLRLQDLVARLDMAAHLPAYALPTLIETAAREMSAQCFYGDEDCRGESSPELKPDWSQFSANGSSPLGRLVYWRAGTVRGVQTSAEFDSPAWRQAAVATIPADDIHHIRRVLVSHARENGGQVQLERTEEDASTSQVSVSVIIPTKNQIGLLRKCLDGLRFGTDHPILEIVIVDNGSDARTQAFYATLRDEPRITILDVPGDFNFSALCNAAADIAKGACLVFLNNDIEILGGNWLHPLVTHAMQDKVGVVGAKLLFSSGRIQHAGVAVGLGGYADHVSHGARADDPGYLSRLRNVHEVSAVTGACIAVEAAKFRAVNGFDAVNLPVELNDIDLCLRLKAAGWGTIMCPDSVLIHHQSASRGFSLRPFERYGRERSYFRARWRDVIRDDPFFHPALSLFSTEPALDG